MDNAVASSQLRAIVVGVEEINHQNVLTSNFNMQHLAMKSTDDHFVSQYPVTLFNVNSVNIGIANSKDEVLELWNGDDSNKSVGTLFGGENPYSFVIKLNPEMNLDVIIGNPLAEFSDSDLVALADSTTETILYR